MLEVNMKWKWKTKCIKYNVYWIYLLFIFKHYNLGQMRVCGFLWKEGVLHGGDYFPWANSAFTLGKGIFLGKWVNYGGGECL